MTDGIDMTNYLLRNEQWLGSGDEAGGNHTVDHTLTDDEVSVFFQNGHLQTDNDSFISEEEFNGWYNDNSSALKSFLESIGKDYTKDKKEVYEAIQKLAEEYLDYDGKESYIDGVKSVNQFENDEFVSGITFQGFNGNVTNENGITTHYKDGKREYESLTYNDGTTIKTYYQNAKTPEGETVRFNPDNGEKYEITIIDQGDGTTLYHTRLLNSSNEVIGGEAGEHYYYNYHDYNNEAADDEHGEITEDEYNKMLNPAKSPALETPTPANAGGDTTTVGAQEPLPKGVPENFRDLYNDAKNSPENVFCNDSFWNKPGLSNFGKLEIVKASLLENNIDPNSDLFETLKTHCSEIYLDILENATGVYTVERLEELRGSLTDEDGNSLIELDSEKEIDAIITMYQNIKDNYMRQGGMGNVTSQFKSLQRLAYFNLSYVADLIQGDPNTETANLEKLANIIHNSSTINNDEKQKAEDWFNKNTKWDDYDSEPRNKKLEIILKDTTLSRGEKYYLINKYCYDTSKGTFIHDIIDKFRYPKGRTKEELKTYNKDYVDELLMIIAGM